MTSSIKTRFLRAFILISLVLLASNIALLIGHTALVNRYNSVITVMSDQYQLNQSVSGLITTYNDLVRSNSTNISPHNPHIMLLEQQITTKLSFLNNEVVDPQAKASFLGLKNSIEDVIKEVNAGLDDYSMGKSTSVEHYNAANQVYGFVQTDSTAFTFDQLQYVNSVEKSLHKNYRNLEISAITLLAILTIGSLLYARRFAQRIVAPLKELSNIAQQIAADKMDVVIPAELLQNRDETGSLSNSFSVMFDRLKEKITELNEAKTSVERQVQERTYQLHAEQAKLLASIQSLPTGFGLADTNGQILVQNEKLHAMFGLEGQASSINQLGEHLEDYQLVANFNNVLQTKKLVEVNEVPINARIARLFISPVSVSENGVEQVIGVVILCEDITEAKILDRSKDEFFSIASHELRTPLTAIKGNTSMILNYFADELTNPDLKDMLDDIHNSSNRLIEIVNDFLDLSRLEQGKMVFKEVDFAIDKVIESVAYEMKNVLEEKGIYLHVDSHTLGNLPLVKADPDRTKQIIYNLVGNAAKFTEKGGISINIVAENKFIKILVTDTGRGISADGQALLFHKFQQAGDSLLTRDTTKGTGLGLYISKMLAEKMGGAIKLEHSEVGKGTTFSLTLPIAKP